VSACVCELRMQEILTVCVSVCVCARKGGNVGSGVPRVIMSRVYGAVMGVTTTEWMDGWMFRLP
jgi:hypothetical protein